MSWLQRCISYYKNNPEGYWFKARLYGWGWFPVKWQGWLVIVVAIIFPILGIYVSELDDAPGAVVIGFVIMLTIIFYFGYKKGEWPRWQWGPPKDN